MGGCAVSPVSSVNSSVRPARSKSWPAKFHRPIASPKSRNIPRNSISTWSAAFSAACAKKSAQSRRSSSVKITPSPGSPATRWCITKRSCSRLAASCTGSSLNGTRRNKARGQESEIRLSISPQASQLTVIRNSQSILPSFLFWIFALLMLVFGAAVVINRNPIASALNLVVSFLGLAALFMSLDAFFVGIIQVLVYAGAIMVLFLFIIMLLDLQAEKLRKINWVASAGGLVVALALIVQIFSVIGSFPLAKQPFPPLARHVLSGAEGSTSDDVHRIGLLLFGNYNLPFQIIGIVILVATIGVVMLSRRETR